MGRSRRSLPEHGGVWAWEVLRRWEDYRAAWRAQTAMPVLEPFVVRRQTMTSLPQAKSVS